jgi:hypothetical protein
LGPSFFRTTPAKNPRTDSARPRDRLHGWGGGLGALRLQEAEAGMAAWTPDKAACSAASLV